MIEVMTKCRVLFLVSLMVAVGGCDAHGRHPDDDRWCVMAPCIDNVKFSAVPCVNEEDIRIRLNIIHEQIKTRTCFTCADYQRLYCREMLEGLKK